MSATTTMTEVLLQSWGSRKGPASLQGGLWTHSPVHARHSLYRWAAPPPGSLCHLGSLDPPGPASWLSGTVDVCCHTPNQVFLISAIYEVEFFTRLRTILNLFLLVALLRNSLGIQCLALKPLMYLCLTSQCDMEVGAKGRHWADRNWLSAVRGWSLSVLTGKGLKFQSMGTQIIYSGYHTVPRRSWYALSWMQFHLLLSEGCLYSTCWCVIIYIFILGSPFLCSFTCIILVRLYMLCSGIFSCLLGKTSLELPKCRKWREMVKVGHRKARSGAERPEFTLQGWHHCHSSWTSKPDPS